MSCRKTACSDKNDVHVITVGKWAIKYIKNGLTTINKLCSCTRKLAVWRLWIIEQKKSRKTKYQLHFMYVHDNAKKKENVIIESRVKLTLHEVVVLNGLVRQENTLQN